MLAWPERTRHNRIEAGHRGIYHSCGYGEHWSNQQVILVHNPRIVGGRWKGYELNPGEGLSMHGLHHLNQMMCEVHA